MADTHEEQLLSDLLHGIVREDAHLHAPHLESRVVASAFARTRQPGFGAAGGSQWVIAAAAAVAVVIPSLLWMNTATVRETTGPAVEATEELIAPTPSVVLPKPGAPAPGARRAPRPEVAQAPLAESPVTELPIAHSPIAHSPVAQSPIPQSPIPLSPITQSPDEFVPLMPMTAQELTGSFQIVRVQMPRASLGALQSPLEHPNELVEADVLLGEDGMARAIRVSASGSVYPWRSR
jgi:hypothetical protein